MPDPDPIVALVVFAAAWVGYACVLVSVLNNLYGRPLSKAVLKPMRLATGVAILAFPGLLASGICWGVDRGGLTGSGSEGIPYPKLCQPWGWVVASYAAICVVVGAVVFPFITIRRGLRRTPSAVFSEVTTTLDLWPEFGPQLHGDGKWRWVPRLPFNCVYRVDFTELTLAPPRLPAEWDGLTVLLLSDLHFHGTPSRVYFERVLSEVSKRWPTPDLVCLAGDYVDTDTHHDWIGPLLGPRTATEAKLAILGNHDDHHHPDRLRTELAAAGYRVLGNGCEKLTVRGRPLTVIGHEGPWFAPPPDLSAIHSDDFLLCLSHTPDNFYWAKRHGIDLVLSGHVHGGQIRLPVIGSIFVPSVYGRRFDQGVFQSDGTVMVVGRGLSGKEPLRFRCHPQVIRITLTKRGT